MITIELMESYNPVLHKVLGGHRKYRTATAPTHIGSSSNPLTYLADSIVYFVILVVCLFRDMDHQIYQ